MKGGAYLRNTLFRNPSEFKRSLRFLAFPNYQLSSNGPFCKIFTYWREKMWVFLAWTTTENWFKVCWPLLKMVNQPHHRLYFTLLGKLLIIFFLCARREILFHWKIDWQLNELSALAFILHCCIIKKLLKLWRKFHLIWRFVLDGLYTLTYCIH